MPDPINDATAYGVRIVEANVTPGALYWKIVRVHHLAPSENNGKHHIYVDALDEYGERLLGTHVSITWEGGDETIVIEKQPPEPGANFPMWKWQVCNAEIENTVSDRVENLRTDHDDEDSGNTLFHHSFAITFQQSIAIAPGPVGDSSISGKVPNGANHRLLLEDGDGNERFTIVTVDESFKFEALPAGRYTITDEDDGRIVGPVEVDGITSLVIDFPPLASDTKPLSHYLLFAQAGAASTQLYLSILAGAIADNNLAFGFHTTDAVTATRVTLVGEHVEGTITLLESAGCQVDELPTDPSAMLAAVFKPDDS